MRRSKRSVESWRRSVVLEKAVWYELWRKAVPRSLNLGDPRRKFGIGTSSRGANRESVASGGGACGFCCCCLGIESRLGERRRTALSVSCLLFWPKPLSNDDLRRGTVYASSGLRIDS